MTKKLEEKLEVEIMNMLKEDLKKLEHKYNVWGLGNKISSDIIRLTASKNYEEGMSIRIADGWSGNYTRLFEIKRQRELGLMDAKEAKRIRKMVKSSNEELNNLADIVIGNNRKRRLRKERYQREKLAKANKNGK